MKTKIYTLAYFISTGFILPAITSAQGFTLESSTFKGVIFEILNVISILIPILFAGAFLVFFWGLSKFILSSNNQADIDKGKTYMMWGVLALFILISFRSIITLVSRDLEIGDGNIHLLNTDPSGGSNVDSKWSYITPGN